MNFFKILNYIGFAALFITPKNEIHNYSSEFEYTQQAIEREKVI